MPKVRMFEVAAPVVVDVVVAGWCRKEEWWWQGEYLCLFLRLSEDSDATRDKRLSIRCISRAGRRGRGICLVSPCLPLSLPPLTRKTSHSKCALR